MKMITRLAVLGLLVSMLGGCFLTKIATTPMRVVGATASVGGAALSFIPVVGNQADAALERVDGVIDTSADRIDDIPL